MNNVDKISQALHHRVESKSISTVVTPLYQCSAFPADSPYFYTRKNNPNVEEFEKTVALLEEATYAVAFSTGMAAIAAVIGLLTPGATVVVNRDIYGCTYRLLQRESRRLDFRLVTLDLSIPGEILSIPPATKLVFFETPTNPFLKTINISAVSQEVKRTCPAALVVVDNTWASPLFQQPIKHGADISLHSATKYLSGHSDVMGGIALCADPVLEEELRNIRFYCGAIMDPHTAWLLRRSLQTLDIRMRAHIESAREMRQFLLTMPGVAQVYFPMIDGVQLLNYGGILFFDLDGELAERYERFRDSLALFGSGTGMAAVTSMVAQPYTGSHASLDDGEKTGMGLTRACVRLCFGLEKVSDLKADIRQALEAIRLDHVETRSTRASSGHVPVS